MEETICLQCGDRGFTNSFIYCVRCLDFAVHRYCLDVIPKTFDEFVHWVCDDCEAKVRGQFSVHKCDDIPSHTRDKKVSKSIEGFSGNETKKNDLVVVKTGIDEPVCKNNSEQSYDACAKLDSVECGELANQCTLMQLEGKNDEQNSSSLQLEEEKVKANSQKKTMKKKKMKVKKKKMKRKINVIECATKKVQHKLGKTSSEHSHECMEVDTNVSSRSAIDSTLPSEVRENKVTEQRDDRTCIPVRTFNSDTHPGSVEHPVISCDGHAKSSKKQRTVELSMFIQENKGLDLGNQCAELSTEERKVVSSNDAIANEEAEDVEESSSTLRWINICRDYPKDLDGTTAEPVAMPIWRGCFSILNKKYDKIDDLVAHASSKACQKVYEAASQFQTMLQFEILPRSEIWPKSFETSEPSGDNIALYFFPSKISEQVFDALVETMMSSELGMKAVVQNAELLIFNSTELPLRYWRFQGKYYIWGVFRGKQKPPSEFHSSSAKMAEIPLMCGDGNRLSPLSNSASCGSSAC